MRTTVEISDSLMHDVRRVMSERGTTLRALVEAGLRRIVSDLRATPQPTMPDARFRGRPGLAPGVDVSNLSSVIQDELRSQSTLR